MKGIDYVIKKTAADLGIPEDQVKMVCSEYWNEIYKKILALDRTTITLRHLGSFTVSRFKLNNFISRIIRKTRELRQSNEETRDEQLQNAMSKLQKALIKRNELAVMFKVSRELKRKKIKKKL